MASKGRKASAGLIMLVKITRGFNAMTTQKAVDVCIMPILTYKALALLQIDQWPSALDNEEIHT